MLVDRQSLEADEDRRLAPYAVRSGATLGREHPDSEAAYRTAFQKDRDRVIHANAFRRLEAKTQVLVVTEGDHYRTRLTHTLEVAQVGRTMARALGCNEDLTETIALAHDLGHPPFGHAGEEELDLLMQDDGGFNHNAQSLRVVTTLELRYPSFPGLNLTWEAREGIVKHETTYDASDWTGYRPEWRPSLEAQIVNLADEAAYNAHDLDDGLRSGLLDPRELFEVAAVRRQAGALGLDPTRFGDRERYHLVRELLGWEVTDAVHTTARRLTGAGVESLADVRAAGELLAVHSAEARAELDELKKHLYDRLYMHYRVLRMVGKARRLLRELFGAYLEAPGTLPPGVVQRGEEVGVGLPRTVCDWVAGMTDRFAMDEHSRIHDPRTRA